MLSPARRGGSSRQSAKTISITAAALALRFALVAVAALVDAYKPLGLRYTDVDYDVLKDGRATWRKEAVRSSERRIGIRHSYHTLYCWI